MLEQANDHATGQGCTGRSGFRSDSAETSPGAVCAELMLWRMARAWVDKHSGRQTWRVLDVSEAGFWYDGEGFFAPRFHKWDFLDPERTESTGVRREQPRSRWNA